jgi:hypothetical protein
MTFEKQKEYFKSIYTSLDDLENVILELKKAGISQKDTVKLLVFELKMQLSPADEIVINSQAWNEIKNDVLKFRNDTFDAFDEMCSDLH